MNTVRPPQSARPNRTSALRQHLGWQTVLRVLIIGAAFGAITAAGQAADSAAPSRLVLLIVALAVLTAAVPDSHAGLLVVATIGYYWVVEVDDRAGPWTLVAALCFAVFHSATALAAVIPVRATGDRVVATRWVARVGLVALGTTTGWGITVVMVEADPTTNTVLFAVALAVLGGGCWLLGARSTSWRRSPR